MQPGSRLYEILGIPKNANENEIKRSYRKLALQYHVREGETSKFNLLTFSLYTNSLTKTKIPTIKTR